MVATTRRRTRGLMAYWDDRASGAENLRLFVPGEGWRLFGDKTGENLKVEAQGSRRLIESAFLNALNATNLLVLTGSGSSFAAKNPAPAPPPPPQALPPPKLRPASMLDLWNAVKAKVGEATFQAVCDGFADAPINENIERLLTLCKLYLELHEKAADDAFERTKKFVDDAEEAILARVNFVDSETELVAHSALITKIGRRGVRKPRAKLFTTNYDL